MNAPSLNRRRRRGFTLIELAIVIGVAAILAAAIVPDIIETMRNKMAERAAADIAAIHDAARLFYVQNTNRPNRWPGEQSSGQCGVGFDTGLFFNDMLGNGYMASGASPTNPTNAAGFSANFMKNAWGQSYDVSVYAPTGAPVPGCLFGVTTNVPSSVSDAFISLLPQASCGAACPASAAGVPPGYTRCCSFAAKPGAALLSQCGSRALVRNPATGVLSCP